MTAQHTPGPWAMLSEETDKPYIRIRGTKLGDRYKIANVLTPVYDGSLERETEETRANARLIAAAPDLLKTLSKTLKTIEEALAYGYLPAETEQELETKQPKSAPPSPKQPESKHEHG